MEPRTQLKIQCQQIYWQTKKKMGRRHQPIPKQIEDETENLTESSNHVNKKLDQHSKRPRKMDSTRRKLLKEFSYESEKKFS